MFETHVLFHRTVFTTGKNTITTRKDIIDKLYSLLAEYYGDETVGETNSPVLATQYSYIICHTKSKPNNIYSKCTLATQKNIVFIKNNLVFRCCLFLRRKKATERTIQQAKIFC